MVSRPDRKMVEVERWQKKLDDDRATSSKVMMVSRPDMKMVKVERQNWSKSKEVGRQGQWWSHQRQLTAKGRTSRS